MKEIFRTPAGIIALLHPNGAWLMLGNAQQPDHAILLPVSEAENLAIYLHHHFGPKAAAEGLKGSSEGKVAEAF